PSCPGHGVVLYGFGPLSLRRVVGAVNAWVSLDGLAAHVVNVWVSLDGDAWMEMPIRRASGSTAPSNKEPHRHAGGDDDQHRAELDECVAVALQAFEHFLRRSFVDRKSAHAAGGRQ